MVRPMRGMRSCTRERPAPRAVPARAVRVDGIAVLHADSR